MDASVDNLNRQGDPLVLICTVESKDADEPTNGIHDGNACRRHEKCFAKFRLGLLGGSNESYKKDNLNEEIQNGKQVDDGHGASHVTAESKAGVALFGRVIRLLMLLGLFFDLRFVCVHIVAVASVGVEETRTLSVGILPLLVSEVLLSPCARSRVLVRPNPGHLKRNLGMPPRSWKIRYIRAFRCSALVGCDPQPLASQVRSQRLHIGMGHRCFPYYSCPNHQAQVWLIRNLVIAGSSPIVNIATNNDCERTT